MTNAKKQAEEIAQLKKELAEVKAAVPKPQKSSAELERENREWMDQMHQMRERRMNFTTPPSVVRDMAGGVTEADCADLRRASHRPTGPSPMAPSSPPVTGVRRGVAGDGTGWSREISLGPSPHQRYVDAQLDAADARDKAERIRQEAQLTTMDRLDDHWWQTRLDDEFEENDWVEIGGFWERRSAMPSFHRSKRDRDF